MSPRRESVPFFPLWDFAEEFHKNVFSVVVVLFQPCSLLFAFCTLCFLCPKRMKRRSLAWQGGEFRNRCDQTVAVPEAVSAVCCDRFFCHGDSLHLVGEAVRGKICGQNLPLTMARRVLVQGLILETLVTCCFDSGSRDDLESYSCPGGRFTRRAAAEGPSSKSCP